MKRTLALTAAGAAALACATSAVAALPQFKSGTSVGEGVPFKAYASITPTVHLFGDSIIARIAIVADTKWVDPSRLVVTATFTPYEPTKAPTVIRLRVGRFAQLTWTWTLACLTSPCVPRSPPSDTFHVFRFHAAQITYLLADRKPAYGITASWPPVEVLSQISPGTAAFLHKTNQLNWRLGAVPLAAPTYRLSPDLVFWLALGLAVAFGVAAFWVGWRRYRRAPPGAAELTIDATTSLERAIAVLRYAHEHADETLQRKAFERVAGELGVERAGELTVIARELAWSPRTPEDEEVEAFAEQAGGTVERDE